MTFCLFTYVRGQEFASVQSDFETTVADRVTLLENTFKKNSNTLHSLAAFFNASNYVNRAEFSAFAKTLMEDNPSIYALHYIASIPHQDVNSFTLKIQDMYSEFKILETTENGKIQPASKRDHHFPIFHSEPVGNQDLFIGMDLAASPNHLSAIQKSFTLNAATATSAFPLMRNGKTVSRGITIYYPIYFVSSQEPSGDAIPKTNLKGLVAIVLDFEKIVEQSLLKLQTEPLTFFFQGITDKEKNPSLFYDSLNRNFEFDNSSEIPLTKLIFSKKLKIADRIWSVTIVPTDEKKLLEAGIQSIGALFSSLVIVLIFSIYIRSESLNRERIKRESSATKLLQDIANMSNKAKSFDEALYKAMALICNYGQWRIGHVLEANDEGTELVPTPLWYFGDGVSPHDTTAIKYENARYRTGQDLPGKALESGCPAWHVEIKMERSKSGEEALPGRIVFPIIFDDHVISVLEFFSNQLIVPTPYLMSLVESAATYLAQVYERKVVENELIEARDQAEAANRAKNDFLDIISHEIRTPMNGVLGMTSLLLENDLTPEQQKWAHIVMTSADGLLTTINDILDFSDLNGREFHLESVNFNLNTIVEGLTDLLSVKANEKNIELSVNIIPGTICHLVGDPSRLRQIIMNLASNAIKFTDSGHVEVRLYTERLKDGDIYLQGEVEDTGIGIASDKQNYIFDMFGPTNGVTIQNFSRTGLGLAICKQLVELMKGEISVRSALGKGSVFHFAVKLKESGREEVTHAIKALSG